MHMANELLCPSVAVVTCGIAAASLSLICRKAKKIIDSDHLAMMGVMGALVFAAQMVNFPLPFMPGASGHITGAILLTVMLGPLAAAIVLSSVVIVQCLIFQDGGLLALGCNIINIAIVPTFVGFCIYRLIIPSDKSNPRPLRIYTASICACVLAMVIAAVLVPVQTAVSGVLTVPVSAFIVTMAAVHLVIGFMEGLITASILIYLRQVRPQAISLSRDYDAKPYRAVLYVTVLLATIVTVAGLTVFASNNPDGLEWSYRHRPDQPDFAPIISNNSQITARIDAIQAKYSILPNYTIGSSAVDASKGWTSLAAVLGSFMTMAGIYFAGRAMNKRTV